MTRATLKRKLDARVRELVLERDGNRCVTCGTTEKLTASHYVKRDSHSTRWLLANVYTQCSSCNSKHSHCPEMLRAYIAKQYGERTLANITEAYKESRPLKDRELLELLDSLA